MAAFAKLILLATLIPQGRFQQEWRSNSDLNKLYDQATPSPTGSLSGPWFDMGGTNVTSVQALKGRAAYLACRIINLGNRTVSWLRHRDTHLLTIGLFEYTPDRRFSAIHRSSSADWVLEIRDVRPSDAGMYECQVSTTPVRSHLVRLDVTEANISTEGGSEVHIRSGSEFSLSCRIQKYPFKLAYVWWYKDEFRLNQSNVLSMSKENDGNDVVAKLRVARAEAGHAGSYSCRSQAGISEPIAVHVITAGETRAGLQVNCCSHLLPSLIMLLLAIFLVPLLHVVDHEAGGHQT